MCKLIQPIYKIKDAIRDIEAMLVAFMKDVLKILIECA